MKTFKLGTQLNISFAIVLFIPMLIATVFSILYYSQKIENEAVNTISSDLKIARLLYQIAEKEMSSLANAYAQKKTVTMLLGLDMGEKLGADLAKSARLDNLDMITVVDPTAKVLVRSHAVLEIGDILHGKGYLEKVFAGKTLSGTEKLDRTELIREGFNIDSKIFSTISGVLSLTGVAPIYDRQREKIVAAIIVRRIVNEKTPIVEEISARLNVNSAIFQHNRLIASASGQGADSVFVPPPESTINKVLKKNAGFHTSNLTENGSLAKYMPIHDFEGNPVGVLMVQRGVKDYVMTRKTAQRNFLAIFLIGALLALIVKSIIVRRIVTPVQRLKKGVELVGNGDYTHRLEVASRDEIGELTGAFNKMAEELENYERQLKDYNVQLERKVEERTSELQVANEELLKANSVLEDTLETLNPGMSKLIGNNKQHLGLVYATEMVADICTYTKLNMILGETMMGEFMKKFYRESHKLLAQYRGMFDKTVGDQIVAIFGTPKDQYPANPYHAFDAVDCARKLVKVTEEINREMQAAIQDNYTFIAARYKSLSREDREDIKIEDLKFQCRVGINTSNPTSEREIDRMRMVMMGAETYVDYTAQGGAVIYAFRLESNATPGEIHIGENTKNKIEHVYQIRELAPITLKGLGLQQRYTITGHVSLFDSIFPKTAFFQKYYNNIPEYIFRLYHDICFGQIRIKEVQKIKEFVEVDLPYLEHMAGYYNLFKARALFVHATAEELEYPENRIKTLVFSSFWYNASHLKVEMETLEINSCKEYEDEDIDMAEVEEILTDLDTSRPALPTSKIIAMCNQFDRMVFDRTYLGSHSQEIMSAKEVISLMKIENRFEPALLNVLEKLMIAEGEELAQEPAEYLNDIVFLPSNPELLAEAVKKNYPREKREKLMMHLG